jgi:hypothetical protein
LKKTTKQLILSILRNQIDLEEANQKGLAETIARYSNTMNEQLKSLAVRRSESEEHCANLRKALIDLTETDQED